MTYIRVLHIPSHLAYVGTLQSDEFGPVSAHERGALRVGELLYSSWDFFDVLHLHTVELVQREELEALVQRVRQRGKRLVMTVHDLQPNIADNDAEHQRKLTTVVTGADAVFTLTDVSRRHLPPTAAAVQVVPHGRALAEGAIPEHSIARLEGPLATFGALRPNRDLQALLTAWQRLSADRPHLRMLLRSVSDADEARDHALLSSLRSAAHSDERFSLDTHPNMLPDDELVAWLRGCSALVLPYQRITHSGQLELACDLGLPVVAPDVPTLRDQLRLNARANHPVTWFPVADLRAGRLGDHLCAAGHLVPHAATGPSDWRTKRRAEHNSMLRAHAAAYRTDRIH